MKAPSKSVLRGRFRPIAICHVGTVPVYSVDGQLHQHQHVHPDIWSRPYQVRCGAEIRRPFRSHISIPKVNVSRAEKLPLFPGYYFLMMSSTCNARSNLSAPEPLYPWTGKDERYWILMSTRRGEISHTQAAKRSRMMAKEYEARAARRCRARSRRYRRRERQNCSKPHRLTQNE